MSVHIRYDPEADAIYAAFQPLSPGQVARTRQLDDVRNVDYDATGGLVGVEFLGVSAGVDLGGVPGAEEIRQAFRSLGAAIPAA